LGAGMRREDSSDETDGRLKRTGIGIPVGRV